VCCYITAATAAAATAAAAAYATIAITGRVERSKRIFAHSGAQFEKKMVV
jgi:hypothetical protein